MKVETQIKTLLKDLSQGIFEKEHILSMALLSAIAGESIFLLGPPGTAKSLVARRLKMAFKDSRAFEYLMSRFSTPDEIFGPVSISLLKNEDRYERVVDGFLPTATIVFLDEIWKASPSIQNSLLTAINERIFQNGRNTIHLPMKGLIAASNELPAEDEGLDALWDRFLVRMVSNCINSEASFFKMIRQGNSPDPVVPEDCLITDELFDKWQQNIDKIVIPDDICYAITSIRKRLKEETKKDDVNDMDYYVSDRRWKKCFRLMRASAFLNGRKTLDMTDLPLLIHCLWNKAETIATTVDVVLKGLTASIYDRLDKIEKALEQELKFSAEPVIKQKDKKKQSESFLLTNYMYYSLRDFPKGKCLFYKHDYNHLDPKKPVDGIIYRDEAKNTWIIRAIYTGTPFDYKVKTTSQVKKVKLLKCNAGIIVDGVPYGLEGMLSSVLSGEGGTGSNAFVKNWADSALELLNIDLRPQLSQLQVQFAKTEHLFLSDDDKKLANKYLSQCEKRLNEVAVKVHNAKGLL